MTVLQICHFAGTAFLYPVRLCMSSSTIEKLRSLVLPFSRSRARSSLQVLLFAERCFFLLLHKARRVREGKREETASIGGGKTGVLVVDFFIAILSSSVPRFSRSRFVGFKDYRQINRPS